MDNIEFESVLNGVLNKCTETLGVKAGEYATEDRLHNFKIAAKLQNCSPITALAGMMCKHTVSVYDLIQKHEKGEEISQEMWDEKIGDSINYLILLSALVKEDKKNNNSIREYDCYYDLISTERMIDNEQE